LVIVAVFGLLPENLKKNPPPIFLSAEQVDFIVINPRVDQTGAVSMKNYWPMFTTDQHEPNIKLAIEKLKYINNFIKVTPFRKPMDLISCRLAASLFLKTIKPPILVNIGVGLPEEVCRLLFENNLVKDDNKIVFFTETGTYGGLPAPGVFFGAAINPLKILNSSEIFHIVYNKPLDVAMLGALEMDEFGNINVSNRGESILDYVGPGGFPDLSSSAKNVYFIFSWMTGGKFQIQTNPKNSELKLIQKGECKFKKNVREITFNGQKALQRKQNVYYISNVGVFKLEKKRSDVNHDNAWY